MNALELRRRTLGKGVYKKTVEGNPAIAQGSLARMYPGITMQGWTEQAQYEGKNLFSIDDFDSNNKATIQNGTILFNQSLGTVRYNLNLGPGAYSISIARDGYSGITIKVNEVLVINNGGSANFTNNFDVSDGDSVVLEFSEGQNPNGEDRIIYDIMLNSGSTALPYEPYTGRKPSPSPDYPQAITSAGKYDEGTGKYEYEVDISTNLIPGTYRQVEQNGVVFTMDNGKITVIGNGNANRQVLKTNAFELKQGHYTLNIEKVLGFTVFMSNETGGAIGNIPKGSTTLEFDISDTIMANIGVTTGAGNEFNEEFYPMLVKGSEPLPYEPYRTPQTVLLTSDRPLTKWDKLEKRNGQWGWVYKSNMLSVPKAGYRAFDGLVRKYFAAENLVPDSKISSVPREGSQYCNIFNLGNPYEREGNLFWIYRSSENKNGDLRIGLSDTSIDTKELFEQYISDKDIYIWYETEEETFVPLSESEQEAMNSLYTFRPNTVLSNDCGCNMTLTYKTKKSLEVTT